MDKVLFEMNVPNWKPSADSYVLVFQEVDGYWREITNNLPQYSDMLLADYLTEMGVEIPIGCQFCRCVWGDVEWELRARESYVRICYQKKNPITW